MEAWQETAAEMLPLCRQWDAQVRLFAERHAERYRLDADAYHRLHAALLRLARQGAAQPGARQARFAEYAELIESWMTTGSLDGEDREILAKVLRRCRQIERELGGAGDVWLRRAGYAGMIVGVGLLAWLAAARLPRGAPARWWQPARRWGHSVQTLWSQASWEQQVVWGGLALAALLMTVVWFSARRAP